jgi:hypothetical protein
MIRRPDNARSGQRLVRPGEALRKWLLLCQLGFAFSLRCSAASFPSGPALAERLGAVTNAAAFRYAAHDDRQAPLDCLKIIQIAPADYLGIHHALQNRVFHLHVSRSTNLLHWRRAATLDEHASQGTLWRAEDGGFLVAYERDTPQAVNMRVRHYEGLAALLEGKFGREFDVPRTLAPTAEGTPDFDRIEWNGAPERSRIGIRFHFYREMKVDRAATGVLLGFTNWSAAPDPAINTPLERLGVEGNIGDRDGFDFAGRRWFVQEAQMKRGDWTSWRLFLFDAQTMEHWPVSVRTHRGSRSFANPTVTRLRDPRGRDVLAATLFLPAQGSAPGEAGALIYVVPTQTGRAR